MLSRMIEIENAARRSFGTEEPVAESVASFNWTPLLWLMAAIGAGLLVISLF